VYTRSEVADLTPNSNGAVLAKEMDSIGERIKALRIDGGWTQAQVAKKLGLRPAIIGHWETGRCAPPEDRVAALEKLFGRRIVSRSPQNIGEKRGEKSVTPKGASMAGGYTYFEVFGPYEIPVVKEVGGRYISDGCPDFWRDHEPSDLRKEKGCYLFALRAAKGYKPVYVGMATRSFGQECFQSHKIASHYNVINHLKSSFFELQPR